MASTRYEHVTTGNIITAWQYQGQIMAPSDKSVPHFIWRAMDRLQISRNWKGNLSVIGTWYIGFCESGQWITDDLNVIDNDTFNLKYSFYA